MPVGKVELSDGRVLIDLLSDTVSAGHVEKGYTFHDRFGEEQTGTLVPLSTEERSVTLGASSPNDITPSSGKGGISRVSFVLDSNVVKPENIAKDAMILGVVGTHEGGGGQGGNYNIVSTDNPDGTQDLIITSVQGGISIVPLIATENGTYTASPGEAFSPVTVNVAETAMNWQASYTYKEVASTSLKSSGLKLTVAKTGTYRISWCAWRSSSTGTMSTRLYINSAAKDTDRTTWTRTYGQQITVNNISLTQGQVVEIYARSGSTSRYCCVANLVLEQTA